MGRSLADFDVLTFDCYGTLIDWEVGIWDALQPLLGASGRRDVTRHDALAAFGRLEARVEREHPTLAYEAVLARVHADLARDFGLRSSEAMDEAFGASIPHWPAFPDTAKALRALASRYRLVVLSNVSRAGFAASSRKLGVAFDAVYLAEDIGSYKPDPANFAFMLARLREDHAVDPGRILHTAQSLFHDHVPARALGLATAWIDRQGLGRGGSWGATAAVEARPSVDFTFPSMAALAAAAAEAGPRL